MTITERIHRLDDRFLKSSSVFGVVYRNYIRDFGYYYSVKFGLGKYWTQRIRDVLCCPDNQYIPRVRDAGKYYKRGQIMHNGLLISKNSYYGGPVRLMLERNRGVHEPQEERAFAEVLKFIPEKGTIIELGAYWGFYSMWFLKSVKNGRAIMVEPDPSHIRAGQGNFKLNGLCGEFVNAAIDDAESAPTNRPATSVDALLARFSVGRVNILHSDIQGAELAMLHGATESIRDKKVDYIFISTHSQDIHSACVRFLREHEYCIIADADLFETYSFDGLIVGRAPYLTVPELIPIARKGQMT